MHINDIERSEDLITTITQQLKNLGVKHRTKKINKKLQVSPKYLKNTCNIFFLIFLLV